jgi:endogenous inhibitor of DNA gyrase (YacG/DUF329 family)
MDKDEIAGPRRGGPSARKAQGRCPICDAPSKRRFRPFCSRRCQDVDLGRWLRGSYRVPTDETPGQAGAGEARPDDDEPNFGGDG